MLKRYRKRQTDAFHLLNCFSCSHHKNKTFKNKLEQFPLAWFVFPACFRHTSCQFLKLVGHFCHMQHFSIFSSVIQKQNLCRRLKSCSKNYKKSGTKAFKLWEDDETLHRCSMWQSIRFRLIRFISEEGCTTKIYVITSDPVFTSSLNFQPNQIDCRWYLNSRTFFFGWKGKI